MRARITPTKADVDRINARCYKEQCEGHIDNNAVMFICVKRFFGLGTKRAHEFLRYLNGVRKEFDGYEADGGTEYFRSKIVDELKPLDIDTDHLWDVSDTYESVTNDMRKARKNTTSVAEARQMQSCLRGFKALVK